MAFKLRIEWPVDDREIARVFDALGEDLRDWTPAMLRVRRILAEMFREIFASQGAALGSSADVGRGVVDVSGGWAPDTQETLRRKMARGLGGAATLHMSGTLEATLANDPGPAGAIRRLLRGTQGLPSLVWGTNLPYAAALHFGDSKRRMPARPMVGITPEAEIAIRRELNAYLQERLAAAAQALDRGAHGG